MRKFIILFLVFLLSVVVRFGNLKRVLDYHGHVTAHTLVTLKIWFRNGIWKYNFNPVYTFNNSADKNVPNLGGIKDKNGNYYYISYPPFAFIFPYIIFKTLQIEPKVVPLYIMNLLLHFIASYFIFLVLSVVYPAKEKKSLNKYAFAGFIIYLFSSGNLWFHQNLFFVDTFVQTLFIISTYIIIKIFLNVKSNLTGYFFLLFITSFLMTYSEWVGLMFSLSIIIFALFQNKKAKIYQKSAVVTGLASFSAVFLTLFQYSTISGVSEMFSEMLAKYQIRSGLPISKGWIPAGLGIFSPKSYLNIIYFYYINYLPTIIFFTFMALYILIRRFQKAKLFSKKIHRLFYFSLFPVLLHYLFFFNFNSNHSFSTLKSSLFLSVAISLTFVSVMIFTHRRNKSILKVKYAVLLGLFIVISTMYYNLRYRSKPSDTSYRDLGLNIRNLAADDEVVYLCNYPGDFIEPQIMYYAERNINTCNDFENTKIDLIKKGVKKAVIFLIEDNRQVGEIERIQI